MSSRAMLRTHEGDPGQADGVVGISGGVILSYERYEWQTEILDELVASEEVREAIAQDIGKRVELADVAREAGFDPAEFGL
jgi:hypothetical protein